LSGVARIAVFAALLVAIFAVAAAVGGVAGPERGGDGRADAAPRPAAHGDAGHAAVPAGSRREAGGADAASPPGLAVSADGLSLELARTAFPLRRRDQLGFTIVDARGEAIRDFAVEHEKRMHLIVVRRDLSGFQHLHPKMGRDGSWVTPLRLDEAGSYRVFADFKHAGEARTLAADLHVDGPADFRALPPENRSAGAGEGYEVRLEGEPVRAGDERELRFGVLRDGRQVHTEPYLGAGGHLVALREGDLAYLHTHPTAHGHGGEGAAGGHDDAVPFATTFPTSGRYRLFFQFKHETRVRTAAFTQEVLR